MINWPKQILQNVYTTRYEKLIEKAKHRNFPKEEYGETHHIIPRSLGGTNDESNTVKLYAREHYIAHLLLWKMSMPANMHNKMTMALHVMVNGSGNKKQNRSYIVPSRIYESARKAYSNLLSETRQGEGNSFYGKKHSIETKKKISEANERTKDIRSAKLSGFNNGMYGKKHTEETKNLLRDLCTTMWTDELRKEQSKKAHTKWQDVDWKKKTLEDRHNSENWINRDWESIARKSANTKKTNGWKPSEESKRKMSETRKKKIANGEIVPWNKGKKMSDDFISSQGKKWEITKPSGEKILFVGNIYNFCKENKIGYDSLRDLANGKQGKNKLFLLGWKVSVSKVDNK